MESRKNDKSKASAIGSAVGVVVLVAASVTGGWVACDLWPKKQAGKFQMPQMAATVAVRQVEERVYNLPEKFVAHAEPVQEVDLLPQVDGYIKEIRFKEGDIVKAGDVLYVLDGERYQAIVNQRKADLAAAEAEMRRADRYFDRMQKADARGITQLELDNAEAASDSAEAAVLQAKANLVVAEYDLKKTQVVAPISGQIGKTAAHVGDYVSPSKGALARIVQTNPMRVSFPLTDRAYVGWRSAQLKGSAPDYRLRLLLPDGSEYKQEGAWAFDDNTMSKETATIIMRLVFPNPNRMLIPNSYVTLLVDYKKPPKLPCVPQQAVVDLSTGSRGVWVLKDDMTVEQRVVETREMSDGWIPVDKGLSLGEKVIVSGMSKLAPGMKVALAEATGNDDLDPNFQPRIKE
ncbi:MAG: efflux RND transporter periplasmic adaptor subunit [Kiritimatiellae bacterium]|nr:efflux RND transporter periplasmic adaptor subunit [Kiritimatiellia bacterium]MBR3822426.1 efflux RND transporter periplasmic adaptor subunit [Kiritimatiellia bacterium]